MAGSSAGCMVPLSALLFVLFARPALSASSSEDPAIFTGTGDYLAAENWRMATVFEHLLRNTPGIEEEEAAKFPVILECMLPSNDTINDLVTSIKTGIDMIMMKKTKKVRRGFFHIAASLKAVVLPTMDKCKEAGVIALDELIDVLTKVIAFTEKKGHIHYKVKEKLWIGGLDIHMACNKFIGEWKRNTPIPEHVGQALGGMLHPFMEADMPIKLTSADGSATLSGGDEDEPEKREEF